MYQIQIVAEVQSVGADPLYKVAVVPPGSLSAPATVFNEHNLQAILHEVLSTSSPTVVREHLNKAYNLDGDLIEIPALSKTHFNMLRGLRPRAAGAR
jgi:ABC-type taurine transport system substrate-binding protein